MRSKATLLLAMVLFGLAMARSVSAGSGPTDEIEQLADRGPSQDVVRHLAAFDDWRLVEALYTAERTDVILEALVAKALVAKNVVANNVDRATESLLDFLQWQLAHEPMEAVLTVRALSRRGDRRASARLYELLVDPSRSDALRLESAGAVHRLGEPHHVAEAHRFLLTLYQDDARRYEIDRTRLIETLGEIGEEGQRALSEWLLTGTGHFAHALQIMAQLLSEPTPVGVDTLLRHAETLGHEPLVQLELLEHLLAAGERIDLESAYRIASSMTDQFATRRDALIWRLRQRMDGHLVSLELVPADSDDQRAVVVSTDQLIEEYLELEGWEIRELWPPDFESRRRKSTAEEPALAKRLLRDLVDQLKRELHPFQGTEPEEGPVSILSPDLRKNVPAS